MKTFKSDAQPPSAELIDRYFLGECTQDELVQIKRWTEQFANGTTGLKMLRRVRLSKTSASWDVDEGWKEIAARFRQQQGIQDKGHRAFVKIQRSRSSWINRAFRLGLLGQTAVMGVFALIFIGLGWQAKVFRSNATLSRRASIYTTSNGERASITLPDGSRVVLNVASQLEVPADYAIGHRTVRLTGEATFAVTPQQEAPFVVMSGPSLTRVLGTHFIVRHYPTDTAALIGVQEGKVSVHSTVLTAGQEIVVTENGESPVRYLNTNRFRFTDGVLVLNDLRLQDAIPQLNRWFDADIRLGDPVLADLLIGGEYATGSIGSLIESLELTFHVRVVRHGRVLTLYLRG